MKRRVFITLAILILLAATLLAAGAAFANRSADTQHLDDNRDHICDTCGEILSNCADDNRDHNCDLCGRALSACIDTDSNHVCDICGSGHIGICDICGSLVDHCIDGDYNHTCDICGEVISLCQDGDTDHICDICGLTVSRYIDLDNDHKCDICGGGVPVCSDIDGDQICDICGDVIVRYEHELSELAFDHLNLAADPGIGFRVAYEDNHYIVFWGDFGVFGYDLITRKLVFEFDYVKAFGERGVIQGSYMTGVGVDVNGENIIVSSHDPNNNESYFIHIPSLTYYTYQHKPDEPQRIEQYFLSDNAIGYLVPNPADGIGETVYIRGTQKWWVFDRYQQNF